MVHEPVITQTDLPEPQSRRLENLFVELSSMNMTLQDPTLESSPKVMNDMVNVYLATFVEALIVGAEEIYEGAGLSSEGLNINLEGMIERIQASSLDVMGFVQNTLVEDLGYTVESARAHAELVGIKPTVFAKLVETLGQPFIRATTGKETSSNNYLTLLPETLAYLIDQHMDWKDPLNPPDSPINKQIEAIKHELVQDSYFLRDKFLDIHARVKRAEEMNKVDVFDLFLYPYITYLSAHNVSEEDIDCMLISMSDILTGEMIIAIDIDKHPVINDYADIVTTALGVSSGREYSTWDFKFVLAAANVGLTAITATRVLKAKADGVIPADDSFTLKQIFNMPDLAWTTYLLNISTRLVDDVMDHTQDEQDEAFNVFLEIQKNHSNIHPFFRSLGVYNGTIEKMVMYADKYIELLDGFHNYAARINLLSRERGMYPLIDLLRQYKDKSPALTYYILELGILAHSAAVNGVTSDAVMKKVSAALLSQSRKKAS